ncbi:MAG: hypothetical protein KJ063_25040 [Anaerolineae bacterium]|nr:hypothetical protein [Anaerolineae bacterium]
MDYNHYINKKKLPLQLPQQIHFSFITFERIDNQLLFDLALKSFNRLNPHLTSDTRTRVLVSWDDGKTNPREVPLKKVDWATLQEVPLEGFYLFAGKDDNYHFSCSWLVRPDYPVFLDWYIHERAYGKPNKPLQDVVVSVAKEIFTAVHACTGYITLDSAVISGYSSPYETHFRSEPPFARKKAEIETRGYYWGNFLTDKHLERMGGLERLKKIPVDQIEQLSHGYYVQLTPDMSNIPFQSLSATAHLFMPVLPIGILPERQQQGLYKFVLDETARLESLAARAARNNAQYQPSAVNTPSIANFVDFIGHRQEARTWLANNNNPDPLAGNRFAGAEEAKQFVESLYAAGAEAVYISFIHNEPQRLQNEGGPYAESVDIKLPESPEARAKIFAIAEEEMRREGFLEEDETLEGKIKVFAAAKQKKNIGHGLKTLLQPLLTTLLPWADVEDEEDIISLWWD